MEHAKFPRHLLLVDGDAKGGASLLLGLTADGYAVSWMRDAAQAQVALKNPLNEFDVALIDWGLPQESAIVLLRAIRRAGNLVPVLILTSRDALTDRVKGLDEGADEGVEDFLVKPFELVEVKARLRALARRHVARTQRDPARSPLKLDSSSRTVRCDDRRVQLTSREFALLHVLMQRPGALLSREQLEAHVYGSSEPVESNAIEFLLHGLRQKLGAGQIVNVRGVGWRVAVEPRER